MIVVADSSPFVVLITIGHIEVLAALYGEVAVPPEVRDELGLPGRPSEVRAFIADPPYWLRIQAPTVIESISGLHAGESAAISLAREMSADCLIIDEAPGRKAAAAMGLPIIGTVGVLELAAQKELLDLRDAFERVKQTDFWVSPAFLDKRLDRFLRAKGST